MTKIEINIENLKNGWLEYYTIHRGYLVRKLYDKKTKENKRDFVNYVELHNSI